MTAKKLAQFSYMLNSHSSPRHFYNYDRQAIKQSYITVLDMYTYEFACLFDVNCDRDVSIVL